MKLALLAVAVAVVMSISPVPLMAKGSKGGGAPAPGTGPTGTSTHVNGYVKKDGTYVAPHQNSTPDKTFENNWTTKGNNNLHTGKDGTRVTEPAKK